MSNLYIGLMSGTSLDGIDAVLVELNAQQTTLLASHAHTLPHALRKELLALIRPHAKISLTTLGALDQQLGALFADATNALLATTHYTSQDIKAIGSHGQTIAHYPNEDQPFSLQIGNGNQIAQRTGITTICDFRQRDIAVGGQGAPLAPAFHHAFFQDKQHERIVLNIGGIANITHLPTDSSLSITGFDTGPGNGLMDGWIQRHQQQRFDANGDWAASGEINTHLLQQLLSSNYFQQEPPKSTGRELFNLTWLNEQLNTLSIEISPADVQATLLALTATSIAQSITPLCPQGQLLVCGGGAHNQQLMQKIQTLLPEFEISSTQDHGIDPDWVEAAGFAWLAQQRIEEKTANIPTVTGASKKVILGAIYPR